MTNSARARPGRAALLHRPYCITLLSSCQGVFIHKVIHRRMKLSTRVVDNSVDNFFKKPIDKSPPICYYIIVSRGDRRQERR